MDAKFIRGMVVCLAVLGICTPQMALAATIDQAQTATDVQLRDGGVLFGQVVTPEQTAVANTTVSLGTQAGQIATGKTDKGGYFAFRGLRSGVYRVAAANGQRDVRVWSQTAAPPAAQKGLMIVAGRNLARGQGGGGIMGFLTSPLGLGLIVATAIAVPVAIHNSKSGTP